MNKEEIKEYLKRVDELESKLTDEDKDTYQWLLFGYNECTRLLNEKEQENKQLKDKLEFYSGLELDKTIDKTRLEYNKLQKENQKYKEVINKANKKLNNFIECCKAEKLESGSDYLHHQYWDMFERFNKQIKDILKEVK